MPNRGKQLARMHQNLGHPDAQVWGNVLRDQGWPNKAIEGIKDVQQHTPKIARPSHLSTPRACGDMDISPGDKIHFLSHGRLRNQFQVTLTCETGLCKEVSSQMQNFWFSWAGPPKQLMSDSAGEFCSEEFAKLIEAFDVKSIIIPAEAHWQMGKCERHGAILQDMLNKIQVEHPISDRAELEQALCQRTSAKNCLSRCRGYKPEILVLGKSRHHPPCITNEDPGPSDYLSAEMEESSEITQFQKNREQARIAFIKSDGDMELRRAFLQRTRPSRNAFDIGQWVMYWRDGKGNLPLSQHGPARALMKEDPNVLWLSHLRRLYRCAPEHI